MNFKGLQALRAFMETGSIAGAADRLCRTPPQVSRLLSALEADVGFPLFNRRNRRLVPTDKARRFYEQVQHALVGVDELTDVAQRVRTDQFDHVRALIAPYVTNSMMMPALRVLTEEMPGFSLSLDTRTRANLELWLGQEQFDLAITVLPLDSALVDVEPLVRSDAVAVMDAGHPLAERDSITIEDLATTPIVATAGQSVLRGRLNALLEQNKITPTIRCETPNGFAACQLAGQGMGLCVADYFVAQAALAPGMVIRPFVPTITLDYVLLFPRWQPRSRATLRMSALIRETVRDMTGAPVAW